MKINKAMLVVSILVLALFSWTATPSFSQDTSSNKNKPIKGEMKQSGKEVGKAGSSLGHNVRHGRPVRGGKHFGKHMYSAGKHFGKGTGRAAKKTGGKIKNAAH